MKTDKNFTIEKIENEFKLKINQTNKALITREQWRKELENRSTLDFFMSSHKIDQLEKLTKFESDHYPILAWIQTAAVSKRRKLIKIIQKKLISKDIIKNTLESPGWPTMTNNKKNKQLLYNNNNIRPTIKLQDKANKILRSEISAESKQISIRQAWTEEFREYIKSIDLSRKQDISRFYKIINSLIQ